MKFKQQFHKTFVQWGDSISVEEGEWRAVATILQDDIHIDQYECYSALQVTKWYRGDWQFGCMQLNVYSLHHIEPAVDPWLLRATDYLGGVEVNLNTAGNKYLRQHANDMLDGVLYSLKQQGANAPALS